MPVSRLLHNPPAAGLLRQARRQLLANGHLPLGLICPTLARSWQRSWDAGLPPCGHMPSAPHASATQLARALEQQRELVAYAQPLMEWLLAQVQGSASMLLLADASGMLLQALGDPAFMRRAERVALRPGASWHEQYRGTNAIGTALTEGCTTVVQGQEHYLERNGFLTCAAEPIRDAQGRLLGALDLSSHHADYHRHSLGLVRTAARMVENRLFDRHDGLRDGLRLQLHPRREGLGTLTEGLLALREDGLLLGANRAALALLGLGWDDLGHRGISQMLAEPLAQLLAHAQTTAPRLLPMCNGQALWARVSAVRRPLRSPVGGTAARSAEPVPSAAGEAQDALAALDTGCTVLGAAIARARKLLDQPIALLLQGETGVGKEVFARAVHQSSARREHAFVAVNCAALPEHLIEAELFGYQAGAFTGALRAGAPGRIRQAQGGTLFLDEIGDMPRHLQAVLLRVLQDRQVVPLGGGQPVAVDFALVCATHRDLAQEMQAGRFREDLYYRLNGLSVQLPSLRTRTDLVRLFANELQRLAPKRAVVIAPALLQALLRYHWPGNFRQLANALRTACALLDPGSNVIEHQHLPDDLALAITAALAPATPAQPQPASDLRSLERQAMLNAVQACGGNLSQAARSLAISRNTLYRRLQGVMQGVLQASDQGKKN